MPISNIPNACLVVLSTGVEAKFFRNAGKEGDLKLVPEGSINPSNLDDEGPSGSFVPDATDQEIDEATFAKQLARHLYKTAHTGKYDDLILIADPVTLGQIRPLLHKEVSDKVLMEINKTLTNSTTEKIEQAIRTKSAS